VLGGWGVVGVVVVCCFFFVGWCGGGLCGWFN